MRILFVCNAWQSSHGGIQTVNRKLALAIAQLPDISEVFCVVQSPSPPEIQDARSHGVRLLNGSEHYFGAHAFLVESRPDVVVGHSYFTGPAAQALAQVLKTRWIQFVHMDPEEDESFKDRAERRGTEREFRSERELDLCASASGVVCVGPRLHRAYGTRLQALGCSVPLLKLDCGMTAEDLRPLPKELDVLTMGRSEHLTAKGLDIFAYAAGLATLQIGARRAEVRFRVRGVKGDEGKLERQLLEYAKAGNPDAITPLAVYPYSSIELKLSQDIRRARVLLMPSRAEAYGLVALESLSFGVPVLVSDRSGVAELLREVIDELPDVSKLILSVTEDPSNCARRWSERLVEILQYPERFEALAQQLRRALIPQASWEAAAKNFIGFLTTPNGKFEPPRPSSEQLRASFGHAPIDYVSGLEQGVAEIYALHYAAEQYYDQGRKAANEGDWNEAYRAHLLALAIWKKLGDSNRISRSLGRLGWCLLAQGIQSEALEKLSSAIEHSTTQAAANYFWAAQYAFRSGNDDLAKLLLVEFARLVQSSRIVRLSGEEMFSPRTPLLFVKYFYESVVADEERLGWGATWSDRGRLSLVKAALDDEQADAYFEEAIRNFERCGLTSYIRFCEAKRALWNLRHGSHSWLRRCEFLRAAKSSLEGVTQRFPMQDRLLQFYCDLIDADSGFVEQALQYSSTIKSEEMASFLAAWSERLQSLASVAPVPCDSLYTFAIRLSTLQDNLDVNDKSSNIIDVLDDARIQFNVLYACLPDVEGYYLPALREVLGELLSRG
jgi:glycosyltransferase involved in cell wall biosynthesis